MQRVAMLVRVVGAVAAVAVCGGAARAQDRDWTPEEAIAELRELVLTRRPMSEWAARNARIRDWLQRLERSRLELGDHDYLRGVALYFVRDYEGAAAALRSHLEAGKDVDPDFATLAGRILLADAVRAARAGDVARARSSARRSLELYDAPATVYRALGTVLRSRRDRESIVLLNEILAAMLSDQRLEPAAKQELLRGLYGARAAPAAGREGRPRTLKPFTATDLDGHRHSLEEYRGKVVLVDFWATWCGPCLREMPHVVEAHRRYADRGLVVLGISLDAEPGQRRGGPVLEPGPDSPTVAKIRATMQRLGMTWPVVYEGGGWKTRLAVENGIRAIPATFLIDRKGRVRYTNLRGDELVRRVAELVAER